MLLLLCVCKIKRLTPIAQPSSGIFISILVKSEFRYGQQLPTSEVTIQEQKLQLRSSESGKPAVGFCQGENCGPFQDFYYYQSEIVEDRPSTLALGLVFGMNQQKSGFYSFAIRPSSAEFALQKFANGQWQNLIEWSSNPAIKFYPFVNIEQQN